ncbi:hypothetical protein HispidOSU_006320 [Sigmodon hispidus]
MEQSEELRRLKESPDYQSFNNSTQGSHQFPAEPTEHAGSLKPSARAPSMAFTQMSSELLVWCGHREAEVRGQPSKTLHPSLASPFPLREP